MSDDLGGNEARTNGSGQSVNVVIGSSGARWIIGLLVVIILMLFFNTHVAGKAEEKANQALKSSENTATEYRLAQFWMQRTAVACEKQGVSVPAVIN